MNNASLSSYNFGAGPACLPQEVLLQIRDDIPNWYEGLSVMEIGHRVPVIMELTQTIENDFRQLLGIGPEFAVLFMHGGARSQYAAVPLNLLGDAQSADYLITGHWSELAYKDALSYCQAQVVASSAQNNFSAIPEEKEWTLNENAAYFHYADNETIHGVEFQQTPPVAGKWLISDMTSNILSKPIDFSRYGAVYASAQKNLGIAGITVVILRKELLGFAHPFTPVTLNYAVCEQSHSMANTPPVFSWYVLGLVVKWALKQGGIPVLAALTSQKAKLIYDEIDKTAFYKNPVQPTHRSRVNIPFSLPSPDLDDLFLREADIAGFKYLKGHRVVGGCRASLYNAMPLNGVKALAEFMQHFAQTRG